MNVFKIGCSKIENALPCNLNMSSNRGVHKYSLIRCAKTKDFKIYSKLKTIEYC